MRRRLFRQPFFGKRVAPCPVGGAPEDFACFAGELARGTDLVVMVVADLPAPGQGFFDDGGDVRAWLYGLGGLPRVAADVPRLALHALLELFSYAARVPVLVLSLSLLKILFSHGIFITNNSINIKQKFFQIIKSIKVSSKIVPNLRLLPIFTP